MTRDQAKQFIIQTVQGPVKATDLAVTIAMSKPGLVEKFPITELFEEITREKRWIEVEYVLREQDYRAKSIFFPLGTLVEVQH